MHHHQGYNDINLTLEFQILMDGIVDYPGISLWGATNNPEKIPMPMIRRFNLVEIVGELQSEDRIKLLQMFYLICRRIISIKKTGIGHRKGLKELLEMC